MNLNPNIEQSSSSLSNTASNNIIADLQEELNKAYTNLTQIQGQNQTVDHYKKQYIEALINCYKHMYTSTTYPWVRYTLVQFQEIFSEECIDLAYHPKFMKAWQHIFNSYTPLILKCNIINSIFCLDTILQYMSDINQINQDNTDKNYIFKEVNAITNKILNKINIYKSEIETMKNFITLFVDNKIKPIGVENFINSTKILFAMISDNKKLLKDSEKYDDILVDAGIIFNKTRHAEIEKQITTMAANGSFSDAQIQSTVFANIIGDLKPQLQSIYNSLQLNEILNVNLSFLNTNYKYFTTLFHNVSKEFNNRYGVTLEEINAESIAHNIDAKREFTEANENLERFSKSPMCLSINKSNKIEKDPNAMAAIIAIKNLCFLNNKDEIINKLKENFSKKDYKDILVLIDTTVEVITNSFVKSINSITIYEIEKKWQDKMGLNHTLIKHLFDKLNSFDNFGPAAIIEIKKEIIDIAWQIYMTHDYSIRVTKIVINTQFPLKTINSKSSEFIEIVLTALPIYLNIQGPDLHLPDMVLQMEEHHNLINALHESYRNNEPQIQNELHIKLLALPNKYKYSHLDNEDILAEILEIAAEYKKNTSDDFSLGEEVDTLDTYTGDKDSPHALVTFSKNPPTAMNSTYLRSTSSNNLNIISSREDDDDNDDDEYSPMKLRKNNPTPFHL